MRSLKDDQLVLAQIYRRMRDTGNCTGDNMYDATVCNLFVYDQQVKPADIATLSDQMFLHGGSALLLESPFFNNVQSSVCSMRPEVARKIHSSQPIARGHVSLYYSRQTDHELLRLINFYDYVRTMEAGLGLYSYLKWYDGIMDTVFGLKLGLKEKRCMEGSFDDNTVSPGP